MRLAVACVCLLALASTVHAAETIPDVWTLEDLLAVAPIDAAGGWKVQIGMSDAGPAAGPVRVLYCLAEHVGTTKRTPATRPVEADMAVEPLGPLWYDVDWGGCPRLEVVRNRLMAQRHLGSTLFAATFIVRSSGPRMTDLPDRLLARWWVNGKPVVAAKAPPARAQPMMRQARETDELRVSFGLPDFLSELKPGDRIRLQVMYSPDGFERVATVGTLTQRLMTMRSIHTPAWPMLTNRIEFELTDELLASKDHPIRGE